MYVFAKHVHNTYMTYTRFLLKRGDFCTIIQIKSIFDRVRLVYVFDKHVHGHNALIINVFNPVYPYRVRVWWKILKKITFWSFAKRNQSLKVVLFEAVSRKHLHRYSIASPSLVHRFDGETMENWWVSDGFTPYHERNHGIDETRRYCAQTRKIPFWCISTAKGDVHVWLSVISLTQ